MSLSHVPVEVLDEFCIYLSLSDVFALIRVSKGLYANLINTLYRLARHYKKSGRTALTSGLQDVTFWFDKCGNGSVMEWAIVHERFSTFERLLLEPRIDLVQPDCYGVTLLHRLSGQGLVEHMEPLIKALRRAEINPYQVDHSLLTPLHYAAGRGKARGVRNLITLGADASAKDHHGNTPLHLAAVTGSHKVLALLVQAGADVNSKGRFGWTPIDQASISHHTIAVDELTRLGSRPPTWQHRQHALNEFVRLSPCPLYCYSHHVDFS